MPTTNSALKDVADTDYVYTGTTTIRFNGTANTMTVTNAAKYGATPTTMAYPPKGVVYVKNSTRPAARASRRSRPRYNEPAGLRAALRQRHVHEVAHAGVGERHHHPRARRHSSNADLKREGDVVMGLIANNYVRDRATGSTARAARART